MRRKFPKAAFKEKKQAALKKNVWSYFWKRNGARDIHESRVVTESGNEFW